MMQRFQSLFRAGAVTLAVAVPLPWATPAQGQQASVSLELNQQFYYAGDTLNLRVSVANPGAATIDNPIRIPLLAGFKVRTRDGQSIEMDKNSGATEPARPDKLSPQSFYGGVFDLAKLYPKLRDIGSYEIYWSGDGLISDMLSITVIPRYDPNKDYVAEIETEHGTILLSLDRKRSPIAVKSFVDMANAGFYQGLEFQEVHADEFIVGGDSRFASPPRKSITYPTELSPTPLVAGTVAMKPISAAPPANGSAFIILLKPQPDWTGQVTVLGQVIDGLEVVQKISKLPSSLRNSQPAFKPLQQVTIRRVGIREKPAPQPAGMR